MEKGEKILASRHSPFNHLVVTEEEGGFRTLRFGESLGRQSVVKLGDPRHLELPYTRVLPYCLAFVPRLSRMLIVGLGGGTLPGFFRNEFPALPIDVVDIDPEVLEVATAYFGFREDRFMRAHIEDARDFIERCTNQYDLIILDGFGEDTIPSHLLTLEFLQAVRNALAPEGIAVANVWGRSLNRLYDHMLLTYQEAFDDVHILDVPEPGTKIFVALQRRREMSRSDLDQWAREDAQKRGLPHPFADALKGYRNSKEETIRGGGVLRD